MGGVETIDMRAHCTQKTKIEATCSHKTKHKHMANNQCTSHVQNNAANENTLKPRVHTRHDNMKAHSQ